MQMCINCEPLQKDLFLYYYLVDYFLSISYCLVTTCDIDVLLQDVKRISSIKFMTIKYMTFAWLNSIWCKNFLTNMWCFACETFVPKEMPFFKTVSDVTQNICIYILYMFFYSSLILLVCKYQCPTQVNACMIMFVFGCIYIWCRNPYLLDEP